jgi:hypothetical protein
MRNVGRKVRGTCLVLSRPLLYNKSFSVVIHCRSSSFIADKKVGLAHASTASGSYNFETSAHSRGHIFAKAHLILPEVTTDDC